MSATTEEFFHGLGRSAHGRLLRKTAGSIRFDIEHDGGVDHWFIAISHGDVQVSRQVRDADLVIRTDRTFFDRMVRGEAKPLTAWLRNDIVTEGNFRFIILLERIFTEPPHAHHPRAFARKGSGQR